MGLSLSWIAVQDGDKSKVVDSLGFEAVHEATDEINSRYACAKLSNGWLIFVATGRFNQEAALAKLSDQSLVLSCEMSETVMVSSVEAFERGTKLWSVRHDPDKDFHSVFIEGEPPSLFAELKDNLQNQQADEEEGEVDYNFDLPIELARSICGYAPGLLDDVRWTVVEEKGPVKKRGLSGGQLEDSMRSELLPFLQARGWMLINDRPDLSLPEQIIRRSGDETQTIYFEIPGGRMNYVTVKFQAKGGERLGLRNDLLGIAFDPTPPAPFLRRLFDLFKPRTPSRVEEAIAVAKANISRVEAFLQADERQPGIELYRGYNSEAEYLASNQPDSGDIS